LTTLPRSTAISVGAAALTAAASPMRARKAATKGRCSAWLIFISLSTDLASLMAHILSPEGVVDHQL